MPQLSDSVRCCGCAEMEQILVSNKIQNLELNVTQQLVSQILDEFIFVFFCFLLFYFIIIMCQTLIVNHSDSHKHQQTLKLRFFFFF